MLELSKLLVLFAAGSSVIVEVEESCRRLGLEVAAVVRNVPGASFALAADRVIEPVEITWISATSSRSAPALFSLPGYRLGVVR